MVGLAGQTSQSILSKSYGVWRGQNFQVGDGSEWLDKFSRDMPPES